RVAMISPHPQAPKTSTLFEYHAENRLQQVREVFQNSGLQTDDQWIFYGCNSFEAIETKLTSFYEGFDLPTALWCTNDDTARLAVEVLQRIGKIIPGDMSIIGYD